jgi:hypothetical protein
VADSCWAATHRDIFSITDGDCKTGMEAYENALDARAKAKKAEAVVGPDDWVGKCWLIITTSLDNEVYRKVSHVRKGAIQSLLTEIQNTLVVNNMEEVAPLRIELYAATMQKDCCSDLQTWISFIVERSNKLAFLKKEVPQDELVAIFLKGLHPVFQQLQVYFSCPGQLSETLDKAIAITRRHAASPVVAAELAKLKSSGTSHNMFPLTQQQPQKSKTICS